MKLTRRQFLKTTAAATISFNAVPLSGAEPGRTYRAALIGCGWWGKNILKEAIKSGRVKIVALCDVDANTLEVAVEQVNDLSGDQPKTYKDYRELLEK
ncbi:MAG TPA: twin-arginine translocation signal domain-containing protein, partial [Verrucomicrobiae bacterium]